MNSIVWRPEGPALHSKFTDTWVFRSVAPSALIPSHILDPTPLRAWLLTNGPSGLF